MLSYVEKLDIWEGRREERKRGREREGTGYGVVGRENERGTKMREREEEGKRKKDDNLNKKDRCPFFLIALRFLVVD